MVLVAEHEEGDPAVDYRGNPADKSKTGGWLAAALILGTELSERICVMGISMNLVTYLVGDLHISSAKSATIVTNFMGTLNLLGLLGGFLADAKLGRYLTVAIFASITALGVTLLTLATMIPTMRPPQCDDYRRQHHQCIEANGKQLALLYAALYTTALGGGGIKSNVSGFGSDQFDPSDPKEEKSMVFFFNRFYFCISLGSLFAVIVLVYIQDNIDRGWGYGISAATMVVAVVILVVGMRLYRYKKPKGSPVTVISRVVFLAWKKRKVDYPKDVSLLNGFHGSKVKHTEKFKCLDKAAIVDETSRDNKNDPWTVSQVTEVEELKMVLKLIPIWSTCILFWTVYSQMTTFTVEQATFMNRNVRLTGNPQGITSLQRIGIGLIFSFVAMAAARFFQPAAALIEKNRRHNANNGVGTSAFWLVPQFFLVGAGEAFAYVGQLEFFIREAPEKMKSMSTGLFLSTISMGFFVSSLLVSVVDKVTDKIWLRSDLNRGKLNNFYWLLSALGVVNFLVFLVCARKHQYKVRNDGESEMKDVKDGSVGEV
ncbi:Protein NRT1/ PTR FAMILY 6.4 [Linum perenne]